MAAMDRRKFLGSLGATAVGGGMLAMAPHAAVGAMPVALPPSNGSTLLLMPSGKDDTTAIQAAIDKCLKRKCHLRLGQGVFHISATLEINKCVNFQLTGMGEADPHAKNGWATSGRVLGTCLRWTGPVGGTMIMLKGAFWPILTGLYLDAANVAAVCVQMTTVDSWGLPTSGVRLRDVRVSRAMAAGIQFMTPNLPHAWNTDLSDFDSIVLDRCAVGIRVCNDQCVGHYWRRIANFSPIGIEFLQGGDVVVERGWQDGGGPDTDTFFLTHGGGENAAQIQIGGIHLEHGRLFDSKKTFGEVVVGICGIQDCRSDTNPPPLGIFGDQTTATLMSSQIKGPLICTPQASVTLVGCSSVRASVVHSLRKLVQGTKKVRII